VDAVAGAGAALVVLAGERLARSPGALPAAAALADRAGGRVAWVPRRANARGAVDAGLVPGLLPGGRRLAEPGSLSQAWSRLPEGPGLDTRGMLEAAANGDLHALYLAGADPLRDFEDPHLARRALERVDTLIMADLLPTETAHHADVLLPACAPQERVGSFTTWEGRRQPFPRAVAPRGLALTDWDILRQLAMVMGTDLGWETAADVRREAAPLMEATGHRAPATESGHDSQDAAPGQADAEEPADSFAVVAVPSLLGRGSMLTGAKALLETARVPSVWVHPADAARLGLADGAGVAVVGSDGRLELPVRITAAVTEGVVVVPENGVAPAGVLTHGAGSRGTGLVRARLEALAGGS
jgi:NADH-quinone oxidoreductase subunit G